MTTACQVPGTQDGQTHFYSIAFSPFKPLIPPSCCCSQCAEFSILLWLLEQGKPPCRFPWLSLSPGCSWLGKAGRDPAFLQSPVCTITSPLRNSALVIEKAKICTTYSSLQETGGVIQDAEILSLFFGCFFSVFKLWNLCSGCCYFWAPRSFEAASHTSVVLHNTSPYSAWKDVLISHHPQDTGVSHKRTLSWEFDLQSPGFRILLYHNNGEQMWASKPCSPFALQNLVASSTEQNSKNTKAEMWQVTVLLPPPCTHKHFSTVFWISPLPDPKINTVKLTSWVWGALKMIKSYLNDILKLF